MDTLSHGLWALAIFWGTSYRWWAFLIGMLPDLLSFGIYLPYRLLTYGAGAGRPPLDSTPDWVYAAYSVTHSLFTWVAIGAILYFLGKRYWPIVGAAMAHIALDFPTHCSYFPTPIFEPFSGYRFCGISWGTPWIFTLNWLCLALVFTLIGIHVWQKRQAHTLALSTRKTVSRRKTAAKLKKRGSVR